MPKYLVPQSLRAFVSKFNYLCSSIKFLIPYKVQLIRIILNTKTPC